MDHKIRVLTCGGTFDKQYPPDKGSYAFVFGEKSSVYRILARASLPGDCVTQLPPKDSLDMDDYDRRRIAATCAGVMESRIVITHGTDTMINTARVIAEAYIPKRIVLTGAAQPEGMKDTDADFNLGVAIGAAQASDETGVFIAMNGRVFFWNECAKLDNGKFVSMF